MTAIRVAHSVRPVMGAAAMSFGIVSIGLHLVGFELFSLAWLVLGVVTWLALAAVVLGRFALDRPRLLHESRTPAALTGVAATTVLGTRLALLGWTAVALVALGGAVAVWLLLMPSVIRGWTAPTVGAGFLLCVATQGVAVLGATVAASAAWSWLIVPSMGFFVIGIGCYAAVLMRFSPNQLVVGAGDHWVSAGALAISALAAGRIVLAVAADGWTGWAEYLPHVAAMIEVVELAAYVLLVCCEVWKPRLQFDLRRWSTVFPMGMTAVSAMTVGTATGLEVLHSIGRILVWPAVLVGTIMLVASARRLVAAVRRA
ncbi:tellurite resistance/C4-dicarboxylate transporter family protein [Rhodococcus sp. Q]|uniref:tellurite resistance/C4-dicarboxylate transporter family protein n=1 Tax=Rhodococcus sp. Q TaxID=2502252 RepID=UPI0020161A92|nr:tellurite resistance/C4-dicarboxylate transporter family protein [Rhodococcus sp. Q]